MDVLNSSEVDVGSVVQVNDDHPDADVHFRVGQVTAIEASDTEPQNPVFVVDLGGEQRCRAQASSLRIQAQPVSQPEAALRVYMKRKLAALGQPRAWLNALPTSALYQKYVEAFGSRPPHVTAFFGKAAAALLHAERTCNEGVVCVGCC